MTLDELKKNTELYSADLSHWPVHLVRPALTFIRASDEARAAFDAALALDAKLRLYEPALADVAALEDKIMAAISPRPARAPVSSWRPSALFAPGGGLLAAAVIGFILGVHPAPAAADGILDAVAYAPDQIVAGDEAVTDINDEGDTDQ